jgi:hypothetical protein
MGIKPRPTREERDKAMEAGHAEYVERVRARFRFLLPHGFSEPKVHPAGLHCTIVYWGSRTTTNVILVREWYGDPWMEIAPLHLSREDRSTRSFALREAMMVLDPEHARRQPPAVRPGGDEGPLAAWLDWYGEFLEAHLDEVTTPSIALVDAIEERRRRAAGEAGPCG